MKKKGLYLDDLRDLPEKYADWDIARTYDEAIRMLEAHEYEAISLDHDLGCFEPITKREYTGYDVVYWLVEHKFAGGYVPTTYKVHSANPVGAKNMTDMIERYLK